MPATISELELQNALSNGSSGYIIVMGDSIMAAASLPLLVRFLYAPGHAPSYVVIGGTTLASILIIAKHRANIARLMNGTENRFTFQRSPRGQQN